MGKTGGPAPLLVVLLPLLLEAEVPLLLPPVLEPPVAGAATSAAAAGAGAAAAASSAVLDTKLVLEPLSDMERPWVNEIKEEQPSSIQIHKRKSMKS